jgi:hypothetical protein
MEDLLKKAVEATNAWGATVMRPDGDHRILLCVCMVNLPKDWAHITNALDETTANGRCFTSGGPVVVQNQPIAQPDDVVTHHNMYAIAVLPIFQNGKVSGTLEVIKDKPGSTFKEKEVAELQGISTRISKL